MLFLPIKCDTRRSIGNVNNPRTRKAKLANRILHGDIIFMRIDTQGFGALLAKLKAGLGNTMRLAV